MLDTPSRRNMISVKIVNRINTNFLLKLLHAIFHFAAFQPNSQFRSDNGKAPMTKTTIQDTQGIRSLSRFADAQDSPLRLSAIKWGETTVNAGFQLVPNVLLKGQADLGLSPNEMNILLHLLLHWWWPDQWPFPNPRILAARMNCSTRTVERALQGLREKGLIKRLPTELREKNIAIRRYDLSGLVSQLKNLAEKYPREVSVITQNRPGKDIENSLR